MKPAGKSFAYLGWRSTQPQTICFDYRTILDDDTELDYTETITFPMAIDAQNPVMVRALNALHIALGISYYKQFLPPTIELNEFISADENDFWCDIFINGLGEFLYTNKIEHAAVASFNATKQSQTISDATEYQKAALLGIGGGKDSIVAGELLKELGTPTTGFVLGTSSHAGQAAEVARTMQVDLLQVERTIDPRLVELNSDPRALNGHIPISVIFGFIGVVLAIATKQQYVVVANEFSASIPSAQWDGTAVNHQWSKSFGFEQSMQRYIQRFITPQVTYFSAIRPLSSLAVAKLFAHYPKYLEVFTSDNSVFKIDTAQRPGNGRWSLEHPKSLSSFIILSPWLNEEQVLRAFGRNYLAEQSLETLFLELAGLEGEPPLDCVGTPEEIKASLALLLNQNKFRGSYLLDLAKQRGIEPVSKDHVAPLLAPQSEQAFPADLPELLPLLQQKADL